MPRPIADWGAYRRTLWAYWSVLEAVTPHPNSRASAKVKTLVSLNRVDSREPEPTKRDGMGFSPTRSGLWIRPTTRLLNRLASLGNRNAAGSTEAWRSALSADGWRALCSRPRAFEKDHVHRIWKRTDRLQKGDLAPAQWALLSNLLKQLPGCAWNDNRALPFPGTLFTGVSDEADGDTPFWFVFADQRPWFLLQPKDRPAARPAQSDNDASIAVIGTHAPPLPRPQATPGGLAPQPNAGNAAGRSVAPSENDPFRATNHFPVAAFDPLGDAVTRDAVGILALLQWTDLLPVPLTHFLELMVSWRDHPLDAAQRAIAWLEETLWVTISQSTTDEFGRPVLPGPKIVSRGPHAPRDLHERLMPEPNGSASALEDCAEWAASPRCRLPRDIRLGLILWGAGGSDSENPPNPHTLVTNARWYLSVLPDDPEDRIPFNGWYPRHLAAGPFFKAVSSAALLPEAAHAVLELLAEYRRRVEPFHEGALAWSCVAAHTTADATLLASAFIELAEYVGSDPLRQRSPAPTREEEAVVKRFMQYVGNAPDGSPSPVTAAALQDLVRRVSPSFLEFQLRLFPRLFGAFRVPVASAIAALYQQSPDQRERLLSLLASSPGAG